MTAAQCKRPTWAYLVEDALRKADDFMSLDQLLAATGARRNQLSAALCHLQKCQTADAVLAQGKLYWFYAGGDTRCRHVEERTPEDKPRRTRKTRPTHKET